MGSEQGQRHGLRYQPTAQTPMTSITSAMVLPAQLTCVAECWLRPWGQRQQKVKLQPQMSLLNIHAGQKLTAVSLSPHLEGEEVPEGKW